ncbi:hypothetical protein [uncultured Corynebacterium sp.]|uniref:hypothetical protein n=1 Tax=uncultured Corynebacterium sp. TaxID=159447 RepID=UPI0025F98EBD|nr:hypothetical protein [uncultured Corynebacterium sp.]
MNGNRRSCLVFIHQARNLLSVSEAVSSLGRQSSGRDGQGRDDVASAVMDEKRMKE